MHKWPSVKCLFAGIGTRCTPHHISPMGSNLTDVTLSSVLHEVPRLWDFLDRQNKRKILWDMGPELRRQASDLVTSIKSAYTMWIEHQCLDVRWLASCNWTHLRSLDLTLDPAFVPELRNGAWPLLTSLALTQPYRLSSSNLPAEPVSEHIFDGFKGKWPMLERLAIALGKLNTTHITALVEIEWTLLKTLKIEPLDRALPALMRGNWPQLTDLSMGVGLADGGLELLSACPWSSLESLELVHCKLDTRAMAGLIQTHLPLLKKLSLYQVAVTDAGACFFQLTCGRWPLLAELKLYRHGRQCLVYDADQVRRVDDILTLTSGKWPNLQSLTFDNFPIYNEDVYVLVQAAWPKLTSLAMLGCFDSEDTISLCMQRWPKLQLLTLGTFRHNFRAFTRCAQRHPSLEFEVVDVQS